MGRLFLAVTLVAASVIALTDVTLAQQQYEFKLGFKVLADMIPGNVGDPVENEHYAANGDSIQKTTTGLMVWRKADNWTAFTDGSRTWVNGPNGLQRRDNSERFYWEPWEPGTSRLPPHDLDLPAQNGWEQVQAEMLTVHTSVNDMLNLFTDMGGEYFVTWRTKLKALEAGIQACGAMATNQSELCNCMLKIIPTLDEAERYWSGTYLGSWMAKEADARRLVRERAVEIKGEIAQWQSSGILVSEEASLLEQSVDSFERSMLEHIPQIRQQLETHNAGALPALRQMLEAPCKAL